MAVSIAAGFLVAGGVAIAAIPDSNGVIHGCYLNSGGNLRVIDSGKPCDPGETALDWSQSGPAGPIGPQGPAGAAGAPGRDGVGATTTAIATGPGSEVELIAPKTTAFTDVRHVTLEPGFYVVTGHVTVIGTPVFTLAPDRGVDRGRRVLQADVACDLRMTPPVDRAAGSILDDEIIHFGGSGAVVPEGRQDNGGPVEVDRGPIGAKVSVNFKSRLTLEGVATVATRSRAVIACHQLATNPSRRLSRAAAKIIAIQVGGIQTPPG